MIDKVLIKKITNQKPFVYGYFHLILIPLYATIFTLIPKASLTLNGHEEGFISNLYFSVITITTLGYGDITPTGTLSQLLVASESILGIILIGLFLNALSHQHGLEIQEIEKRAQIEKNKIRSIHSFLAFNKLIELNIE